MKPQTPAIKPILTKRDYEKALVTLDRFFDARPGTNEGEFLEVLARLIEDYEEKSFPIER